MSSSRRSLSWKSALALLSIGTGAVAHAQILRERDLGAHGNDSFGQACANAGDVDGDGMDDFVVGAYAAANGVHDGIVVVYSGATGATIRTHYAPAGEADELGFSVAGAGDVDGDGVPDYVVGAPNHSVYLGSWSAGEVVVYSGKSGTTIWTTEGSTIQGHLGHCVAGIGDVDGDGKGDVIAGTRNAEIFVFDASGNTIHHVTNPYPGFGWAVCGCDDFDGDGVNDFVVGSPYADLFWIFEPGAVIGFSGATGGWLYTIWGTNASDQLGWKLAQMGDVNGDGIGDYLAAGPYADVTVTGYDTGIVRVVSGNWGGFIREHVGDRSSERLGSSISGMDDVDGDGVPDYAVGACDAGTGWEGRVRVYSGSDGHTIYERYGVAGANIELGSSVASGDWNGDGVADLLTADEFFFDPVSTAYVGCVDVELMCPAWRANYGAGWPGNNGIPSLTAQQDPEVGSPIDLDLGNSLGAATTALLFVGLQSANVPLNGSGTLLVAPFLSMLLPVPAAGLTLNSTLPSDPALYFLDVYVQAIELDSFASKKLSFTPGLQLHCGFDLP